MSNQLVVPSLGQQGSFSPQPVAFPYKSGDPPEGPLSALVILSIPAGQLTATLNTNISQFGMSMVQSLLVDNEANSVAITVKAGTIGTNFGIQPLGTQIIPVFQTGVNLGIMVTLAAAQPTATVIAFQIFNAFVPPASWVANLSVQGNLNVASITGTVNVAVQNTVPVNIAGGNITVAGGVVNVTGSTVQIGGGVGINPYPAGATPIASTANGANTGINTNLNPTAGRTSYLSNCQVSGLGATNATTVIFSIAGLVGGALTFYIAVPAGVTTPIQTLILNFNPAIPANGANTNIFSSLAAFGAGNTAANLASQGYMI